jgi:hypothetical protein
MGRQKARTAILIAVRSIVLNTDDYSCGFSDLRDHGGMRYGEVRPKAGLARLSRFLMPISGKPEIGEPEGCPGFCLGERSLRSDSGRAERPRDARMLSQWLYGVLAGLKYRRLLAWQLIADRLLIDCRSNGTKPRFSVASRLHMPCAPRA